MVDIFTKFINTILIKTKTIPEMLEAVKTVIGQMGKPESIYTDNEGAWSAGTEIDKYFKDNGINHIITLSRAAVEEREVLELLRVRYTKELHYHQPLIGVI